MTPSIETRASWVAASISLTILAVAFGGPWIAVVALKTIAAETGGARSVPAFASSLAWFGAGVGGIGMGWVADRYGVRWTVLFGSMMIALGLAISAYGAPWLGQTWALYIGHGLFIGLIGNAGLNAPMYVYVSRWFDKRRGSALALISSGQYIAGAAWPPIFDQLIAAYGWRQTMFVFGLFQAAIIVPIAIVVPEASAGSRPAAGRRHAGRAEAHRARLAAQSRVRHADGRGLLLLRADVDAAGPSRRALHRSRHIGDARRRNALGAARRRVLQPPDVGLDFGPDRRAYDGADRLGVAVPRRRGVRADAG